MQQYTFHHALFFVVFLKDPGHYTLKRFQSPLMDDLTCSFKGFSTGFLTGEPNAGKAALPLGRSA